jgi:hypothetical protein
MKIGFYLAHPAHFHLFKNVIKELRENHAVFVCYNKKDVLRDLVINSDFKDIAFEIKTLTNVRGKLSLIKQFLTKLKGAYTKFKKEKPDLVVGTPILISLIGKVLGYKSIIVNEDDFDVIKQTANLGYPFASQIIAPKVCRTGKFASKTIQYEGYHELAYLHPDHFTPNPNVVENYFSSSVPYFIIRFAKLAAHHDKGIRGINISIAKKIIQLLEPYGTIYITSERELETELEKYRINIDPKDMHHVMAFATLYIGDSQTMAAEAGVLGTPFIRFNDFVGRISYLKELEDRYQLGYGIKPTEEQALYAKLGELMSIKDLKNVFRIRKDRMLSEKINVANFLTHYLSNYKL